MTKREIHSSYSDHYCIMQEGSYRQGIRPRLKDAKYVPPNIREWPYNVFEITLRRQKTVMELSYVTVKLFTVVCGNSLPICWEPVLSICFQLLSDYFIEVELDTLHVGYKMGGKIYIAIIYSYFLFIYRVFLRGGGRWQFQPIFAISESTEEWLNKYL